MNTPSNGQQPFASENPVLLVVDSDQESLQTLTEALERRFGADYRIQSVATSQEGLDLVQALHADGDEVALIVANVWLDGMNGVGFLARAHACYPDAKRVLVSTIGDAEAAAVRHRAMALGQIDLTVGKPWRSPEEQLYPRIGDALAVWWRANRPRLELVRVVGEMWAPRSHELRDLGTRNGVPFGFYPVDSKAGQDLLAEVGVSADRLPVAVMFTGQVLIDPTNADLAEAFGVATHSGADQCDVVIIGAGPAGMAAAVYAASEGLRTTVVEPEAMGGQAGTSSMIRNYLGFPDGVSGAELTNRAYEQAITFGARFIYGRNAVGMRPNGHDRVVTLSDGSEIASGAVIIASGVTYRRLGVPSLERLVGAGVFYGAATAEAIALAGENVCVVGAGNSAGQAALYLAVHAKHVTLLVRGESLTASMSAYLIDQLEDTPNIDVRVHTQATEAIGEHHLEAVVVTNSVTGERETLPMAALFALIGAEPRTEWLDGILQRDERGYLLTSREVSADYNASHPLCWTRDRTPFHFETSLPGVFAVGDVRHESVKRVAAAVGEGAVAISGVHAYLAERAGLLIKG